MIKIENVEVGGLKPALRGMRNPKNSWTRSDSGLGCTHRKNWNKEEDGLLLCENCGHTYDDHVICAGHQQYCMGPNDHDLAIRLRNAGTDHRKYLRMIVVWLDVIAPLYWWKEADTYKVGTVANSCSTMHKVADKEFSVDDFSHEHLTKYSMENLDDTIAQLNFWRGIYLNGGQVTNFDGTDRIFEPKDKDAWWQLIQLLPSSYNQRRTLMVSYEVLANIYKSRRGHKLDEWRRFCYWIETLPYSELITGKEVAA